LEIKSAGEEVKDVNETFDGSLLKTVRLKNGATQESFADMLGISRNYLYMMESGLRSPGGKLLKKISRCTDVPIESFLVPRPEFQDEPDDPGKPGCLLELSNRLNRERYERKLSENRIGELEKLTEHLMALNDLLFKAGRVYRMEISAPEKAKKLAALTREAARAGELCFGEISHSLGVKPAVLTRWLEAVKTIYKCRIFPEKSVSASTPGGAGAKLCCFDCDARDKGDCNGFGDMIHPENVFGIISLLESNGVTNRDEEAEIISSLSDREISAHQISDLISRKKRGLPIPEDLLYLTSGKRK
jgi:transcriptional regulator with XRE-family HTH domain